MYCPEPLMLLHEKINELASGQVLKVIATDPATLRDVPKFCHFLQIKLLKQATGQQQEYCFWLSK